MLVKLGAEVNAKDKVRGGDECVCDERERERDIIWEMGEERERKDGGGGGRERERIDSSLPQLILHVVFFLLIEEQ